jgi:hypothetical protein
MTDVARAGFVEGVEADDVFEMGHPLGDCPHAPEIVILQVMLDV